MATFNGKHDTYEIGDIIAENERSRTRSCHNSSGRELLLQIAIDASQNVHLSRNAWVLTKLKQRSDAIDKKQEELGGRLYNYSYGFPEIYESMILESQGSRQINVIGFNNIRELPKIVPLVKFWKNSLRVDLPTSAWIMGKLLKIISFAHDNRIEVGDLSGNNVLISPDDHYVIVFDWSKAIIHEATVPLAIVREEVKYAAQLIIKALGDDLDYARRTDADIPYTNYLQYLAANGESEAAKAHQAFYDVVDSSTWTPTPSHCVKTRTPCGNPVSGRSQL